MAWHVVQRRSSAQPSLGSSGRSSISLQPNTPQRLHEASRRSLLAPTTFQDPLQQHFDEALPADSDSFEPAAFSPAYGVVDQSVPMTQEAAEAEQRFPPQERDFSRQPWVEEAVAQDYAHLPLQVQQDAYGTPEGRIQMQRGEEGSLRRAEDSFTFSTDAPHQKLREAAHLPEAVPNPGSFTEKFAQMPVQRVSTLSEGDRSGEIRARSEPVSVLAAVRNVFTEAPPVYQQSPTKQAPSRAAAAPAEPSEPQPRRRISRVSSGGTDVVNMQNREKLTPLDLPDPMRNPHGVAAGKEWQAPAWQREEPSVQQVNSNPLWSAQLPEAFVSAEEEDFSSVRATGSMAWSNIGSMRAGSVPMHQAGETLTWSSRSLPAGMTAGHLPAQGRADAAAESTAHTQRPSDVPVAWDEGRQRDINPTEVFKVYDNQVAASTEAAEQLLHSAALQANQVRCRCPNNNWLEASICFQGI